MFWVFRRYIKEGKAMTAKEFVLSEEWKKLSDDVEKETGIRFVEVYWNVLGGEFDTEAWYEVPNWAAIDSWRESKAVQKAGSRLNELDFIDTSRPGQTLMLRTTEDVKLPEPPKKEE